MPLSIAASRVLRQWAERLVIRAAAFSRTYRSAVQHFYDFTFRG